MDPFFRKTLITSAKNNIQIACAKLNELTFFIFKSGTRSFFSKRSFCFVKLSVKFLWRFRVKIHIWYNVHIFYHSETNFDHFLKISINFGTYSAQSLLNHKCHLWGFKIYKRPLITRFASQHMHSCSILLGKTSLV